MENWMEWVAILLGGGSIGYLLTDRFLRTPQQKGADYADMVSKMSDAFEKTLQTTMRYSQDVIEKMKQDDERSERRYAELENRCEKLERRLDEKESELEELKNIVGGAVNCKFLKDGHNNNCPVLREDQKRLAAKCRVCTDNQKPQKIRL